MGRAMKYFPKKLLGDAIFRSSLWFEKFVKSSAPPLPRPPLPTSLMYAPLSLKMMKVEHVQLLKSIINGNEQQFFHQRRHFSMIIKKS